ncbi:MAG TPA: FHA domain-containing protein, partial [Candidatus Eremiobacteraeota bacterium]|nr:FHA domain-containing protein [Candidatus Eremiobacteraeota bacterium]
MIYNREGMGQQSVPLDKDCINIGRSRKSDLLLDFDPLVSGHHARIIKTGKRFFIEDLGSSNKTFLNDKVIRSRCELKHKDRIKIGNVILTYIDMKIRSEDIPVKEAIKRRSKKFSWQRHMIAIIAVLLTGGFCLYYFLSGTFHKSKIEEHIKKGEDYFNDGAYDKAINEYEYVLTLDKDNRKAYGGLGDSRRAMFDYLAAIKEYKKIVKLSPDDTYYFDICNSTGDTWFLYNDYREALRSYKIVEEAHFNNPDDKEILDVYAHTLIGLGKIDFINHKYKEAGDKYKKTLDIDNKNIKALIALGYLYLETGKYEDSMHYFSTVRGAAPKNTEATTGIASIYKKKGDFNRALEVYKDLIKDDASAPEIYTGKADLYRVMKNYGEALSVLKDGEKKDRKNPMIYVIRSKVYFD